VFDTAALRPRGRGSAGPKPSSDATASVAAAAEGFSFSFAPSCVFRRDAWEATLPRRVAGGATACTEFELPLRMGGGAEGRAGIKFAFG